MPLVRDTIVGRMNQALLLFGSPLERRGLVLSGGLDELSVVIRERQDDSILNDITLQFPSLNRENGTTIGVIIGVFFSCTIPTGTEIPELVTAAVRGRKLTGAFSRTIEDVEIRLTQVGDRYSLSAHQV